MIVLLVLALRVETAAFSDAILDAPVPELVEVGYMRSVKEIAARLAGVCTMPCPKKYLFYVAGVFPPAIGTTAAESKLHVVEEPCGMFC